MSGVHTCYKIGRPDALAEVSIFPATALEYCGFSRSQRSSVQHVIRAFPQQRQQPAILQQPAGSAAAGPAEGVDSTGPQATEGAAAAELDIQTAAPGAAADASSAAASDAAGDLAEVSESVAATGALGDETSAADPVTTGLETDASVTSQPAAELQQGAPLQPCDRGCTRQCCQPSRQPFQLQFHRGARADGMLSHRQYGGASSCRYEGRQDCMSRRDVTFSRRGGCHLIFHACNNAKLACSRAGSRTYVLSNLFHT